MYEIFCEYVHYFINPLKYPFITRDSYPYKEVAPAVPQICSLPRLHH